MSVVETSTAGSMATAGQAGGARLLAELARAHRHAVVLAEVVSLAAHIEPALLRRARIMLVPGADSSAEADLWWSNLVDSRGPLGFVLRPDVAEILRHRLAAQPERYDAAWRLTEEMHRASSPAVQVEERVAWLSGQGAAADVVARELLPAVKVMASDVSRGDNLARWAARAIPRLPAEARASVEAWMLALGAAARTGGRPVLAGEPPSDTSAWLGLVLPPDGPTTTVGARLLEGAVELSYPARARAHRITVPVSEPVVVDIARIGDSTRTESVSLPFGETRIHVLAGEGAELTSALGNSARLAVPDVDVRIDIRGAAMTFVSPFLDSGSPLTASAQGLEELRRQARAASSPTSQFDIARQLAPRLPATFWDALRAAASEGAGEAGRPPTVLVTDEMPPLPWELVPVDPPPLLAGGAPYLGAQASVAHWSAHHPAPLPLDLEVETIVVVGTRDADSLITEWDAHRFEAQTDEELRRNVDVLHFGDPDPGPSPPPSPEREGRLPPEAVARSRAALAHASRHCFSFITEELEPGLTERLIDRGGSAVVARRWVSVDAVAATAIALDFYDAAFRGAAPVAEILRSMRAEQSASAALAYQYVGHPALRMVRLWPAEVWDVTNGVRLLSLDGQEGRVEAATWTRDGRVVTGSSDGTVRVWDGRRGHELLTIDAHEFAHTAVPAVEVVAVSHDGTRLVSTMDHGLAVHDLSTGALLKGDSLEFFRAKSAVWSRSGDRVLFIDDNYRVLKYHPTSDVWPHSINERGRYTAAALSPDGEGFVVVGNGVVERWDAFNARKVSEVHVAKTITAAALLPDGVRLAFGTSDGQLGLWGGNDRIAPRTSLVGSSPIVGMAVSPTGDRVAVASAEGRVDVYDVALGAPLLTIPAVGVRRTAVAFSPDGGRLLSWSPSQRR